MIFFNSLLLFIQNTWIKITIIFCLKCWHISKVFKFQYWILKGIFHFHPINFRIIFLNIHLLAASSFFYKPLRQLNTNGTKALCFCMFIIMQDFPIFWLPIFNLSNLLLLWKSNFLAFNFFCVYYNEYNEDFLKKFPYYI